VAGAGRKVCPVGGTCRKQWSGRSSPSWRRCVRVEVSAWHREAARRSPGFRGRGRHNATRRKARPQSGGARSGGRTLDGPAGPGDARRCRRPRKWVVPNSGPGMAGQATLAGGARPWSCGRSDRRGLPIATPTENMLQPDAVRRLALKRRTRFSPEEAGRRPGRLWPGPGRWHLSRRCGPIANGLALTAGRARGTGGRQ